MTLGSFDVPSPLTMFGLMIALTAGAVLVSEAVRRRTRRQLTMLAREADMHYSPFDRLTLTPRVAVNLPVVGAAGVRVRDVLYRSDAHGHLFVFTTEYTTGVIRGKSRHRRVATFAEPRARGGPAAALTITLAPADCHLLQQYRAVLATLSAVAPTDNCAP